MSWFQRPSPVAEADPSEAADALAGGEAILVDVRDPHEWAAGHAVGARHLPLPFLASRATELPAGSTVYVICASGHRSRTATEMLSRAGFRAFNVRGGTIAWMRAGLPMARD
jgi:rhodanese-related sulfurtransferase